MRNVWRPLSLVLLLATILTGGCGPKDRGGFTVSGKVLVDGAAPAADLAVDVTFVELTAGGAIGSNKYSAEVLPEGTYEAKVPAGTYRIMVTLLDKDRNDVLKNTYGEGTSELKETIES